MNRGCAAHSSNIMRKPIFRHFYLPVPAFLPHLVYYLIELRNPGMAYRMPFCLQASAHVDWNISFFVCRAFPYQFSAFALLTKTQILVRDDFQRRKGIMHFG